jgi:hypothetical protein
MEKLAASSRLLIDRTIHVTVPASVAFDFKKMTKVTQSVLDRLGCPGCHSGFAIRFDIERQMHFNEKAEMIGPG